MTHQIVSHESPFLLPRFSSIYTHRLTSINDAFHVANRDAIIYCPFVPVGEQPSSNQSVGIVMEDAAVFGGLFSRLRSWDQVPSLMEAYHDLRQERAHFVACKEYSSADIVWLPPGPHRDARDAAMRAGKQCELEDFSERVLREQWDTVSEVFAYSASDAAADWWAGWGVLGERAKKRSEDFLQIEMTVVPQVITT